MSLRQFSIAVILVLFGLGFGIENVQSKADYRYQKRTETGSVHFFQLKRWSTTGVLCEIYVTHDGYPTQEEFEGYCGADYYTEWATTPACDTAGTTGDSSSCLGSYLVYYGKFNMEYPSMTSLPAAEAQFSIVDCAAGEWCSGKMKLRVTGVEPLKDYEINAVHITVEKKSLTCKKRSTCDYSLPLTGEEGIWVEFWVDSTFGDSSPHRIVHLRQIHSNDNGGQYRVDVIAPESTNIDAMVYWDSFPSVTSLDSALYDRAGSSNDLQSSQHLYLLAGKLIMTGVADGSGCPDFGLLNNGNATTCGEEAAYPAVVERQNQFNQQIYTAAEQYQMPPRLIKGLITQESQFWTDPGIQYEYGMGSLSENGIDVYLSWDVDRYLEICVPELTGDICKGGYDQLTEKQKAYLRGMVLRDVGTDQEIALITRVLKAYSVQVGQTVENITGSVPGEVASYESLWDLSIASYHAGIGCVANGIELLNLNQQEISYTNFCAINTICPSACPFVEKVKEYARP